jgi:L-lactate dehydrogenase complex protein LldG
MVAIVREFLREKFFKADVGISGANVFSADTGTMFIIENEGNGRLSTASPPKHIALIGMEKVVPTFQDACKVSEVTWRFANYDVVQYVSLISGPSKIEDTGKKVTYGIHGPKEMHVVFLDNGRSQFAKHPILKEALYCLRCGACLYECPVYAVTSGYFGDKYFAGIGSIWTAMIAEAVEKAIPIAYTCLICGRCKIRCPLEINIPKMNAELRKIFASRQYEQHL